MSNVIMIQTTSDNKEILQNLSKQLIDRKLAACCQISGPIESLYHWKGTVESSIEWLCSIKTTRSAQQRAFDLIQDVHNYELPEIISFPIDGATNYLNWVQDRVE